MVDRTALPCALGEGDRRAGDVDLLETGRFPESVTATSGTSPNGRRVHIVHNWSWESTPSPGGRRQANSRTYRSADEVRKPPISRATASGSSSMDSTYAPGTSA
jgi:hypothetical protein